MPQNFEWDDQTRAERLSGTLHAPGATTGDVLTVNADKSISPAAGGGSQPVQAVYSGDNVDIGNGAVGYLTWDNLSTGSDLLDRATPDSPLLLAAGCYAITATLSSTAALTAGGFAGAFLLCELGTLAMDTSEHLDLFDNAMAVGGVFVAADITQPLRVGVFNQDGAVSRRFQLNGATVVKLA